MEEVSEEGVGKSTVQSAVSSGKQTFKLYKNPASIPRTPGLRRYLELMCKTIVITSVNQLRHPTRAAEVL